MKVIDTIQDLLKKQLLEDTEKYIVRTVEDQRIYLSNKSFFIMMKEFRSINFFEQLSVSSPYYGMFGVKVIERHSDNRKERIEMRDIETRELIVINLELIQ